MSLIEVSDEIFIVWIFYSWLEIVFLTLKGYWHNSNHLNCIKLINIEHIQLKPLIFKNDLILIGILEVLFIAEVIASIINESISNTVNHSQLINDIEIELWKELISAGLTAVQLTDNDEVFQIFIISEHSYRISSAINLKASFFKCFNND